MGPYSNIEFMDQGFANVVKNRFVSQRNGLGVGNPNSAMEMGHGNSRWNLDGNVGMQGGKSQDRSGRNTNDQGFSKLCRNGRVCEFNGCHFQHNIVNKPCKFGSGCIRKEKCLFQHNAPQQLIKAPVSAPSTHEVSNDDRFWLISKNVKGRGQTGANLVT